MQRPIETREQYPHRLESRVRVHQLAVFQILVDRLVKWTHREVKPVSEIQAVACGKSQFLRLHQVEDEGGIRANRRSPSPCGQRGQALLAEEELLEARL